METPLVDDIYVLQKFPGKGGWTFAEIPEILQDKDKRFGWVKVKGSIDDYVIKDFNLAPMKNGKLFMPVRAEIRKKIGKQAGDSVRIVLFRDNSVYEVPPEILECLEQEPAALK